MSSDEKDLANAALDEARDFIKAGEYDKALERYVWYHRNALEIDPAHYGVRLSFALSSWKSLGDKYAPALDALKQIRDENVATLLSGTFNFEIFDDLVSINNVLEEYNVSIDVFRHLQAHDPDAAKECFRAIQELLLEKNEWELFYQYAGDLLSYMEEHVKFHNHLTEHYRTSFPVDMTAGINMLDEELVKTALSLIQIARSKNDDSTATKISQLAYGIIADPRLGECVQS